MRRLTLREYRREPGVELTPSQRDAIAAAAKVDVRPTPGRSGAYDLTPGSTIGTLLVEDLQVDVRPKIALDRVLFLISYALAPVRWRDDAVLVDERATVVEAMAHLFVSAALRALHRGPLQGYRRRDEALPTVRGRIRIDDQVRGRYGLMPPVEVTYDEFTTDITENRLIKDAALRIARMPLRDRRLRDRLAGVLSLLGDVPAVTHDPRRLPEVAFTRLNRHYRPVLELASLVIRSSSLELGSADLVGRSFLVNMNEVFETFFTVALREAMPTSRIVHERGVDLDVGGRVPMKPDLTWVEGGRPVFVGDAKYKALRDSDGRNADLYQMLAYVIALGLPAGMLVYAAGEGDPGRHEIVNIGRQIHVEWLDVSGQPGDILSSVDQLAGRIRSVSLAAVS
jgi:5-methylcytosine-specific restriction enzyme subunit McrC